MAVMGVGTEVHLHFFSADKWERAGVSWRPLRIPRVYINGLSLPTRFAAVLIFPFKDSFS